MRTIDTAPEGESCVTRFEPIRAGIINMWDYRDEEFCFADGWLVLRGPNGSGKTKALEVLFPFVLDGRIDPKRLNPFAAEDRTMKSNLLFRGAENAVGYVWLELRHRGTGEAVTIGVGLHAARHRDTPVRWHFVADGRAGVDFSLITGDDRPMTRKQLAEQIGEQSLYSSPAEYRTAIDQRLFGLGFARLRRDRPKRENETAEDGDAACPQESVQPLEPRRTSLLPAELRVLGHVGDADCAHSSTADRLNR